MRLPFTRDQTNLDEVRSLRVVVVESLVFTAVGTALTLLILGWAGRPAPVAWSGTQEIVLQLAVLASAAVVLRALRRFLFFFPGLGWTRSCVFEILFQGAILLNPRLPYPSVEREFLRRHLEVPEGWILGWFDIRSTSALLIPLLLLAHTFLLAGMVLWSAGSFALGLAVCIEFAWRDPEQRGRRLTFICSLLAGGAGALLEARAFVTLALHALPDTPAWSLALVHLALLVAYELSPFPFALGILELSALCGAILLDTSAAHLCRLAFLYRLCRGTVVVVGTRFLLPSYKLTVRDLFDPLLAVALHRSARPEGGWPDQGAKVDCLLSVVIPAYNEAERLPAYLPSVAAYAAGVSGGCEVLVVDDGSQDRTAAYVDEFAATHGCVQLLRHESNRGKGAAVRTGVARARGAFVLFADADGATPIAEADRLLRLAREGVEVVIGSRKAQGSSVDRSLARATLGNLFYRLTNLLAVPSVADTQCGFKLFRRVAAETIFPLLLEEGWAFDVEILFLAQKLGMAIVEVPVRWTHVEGTRFRFHIDTFRTLAAIHRIRRRHAGLTCGSGARPASADAPTD